MFTSKSDASPFCGAKREREITMSNVTLWWWRRVLIFIITSCSLHKWLEVFHDRNQTVVKEHREKLLHSFTTRGQQSFRRWITSSTTPVEKGQGQWWMWSVVVWLLIHPGEFRQSEHCACACTSKTASLSVRDQVITKIRVNRDQVIEGLSPSEDQDQRSVNPKQEQVRWLLMDQQLPEEDGWTSFCCRGNGDSLSADKQRAGLKKPAKSHNHVRRFLVSSFVWESLTAAHQYWLTENAFTGTNWILSKPFCWCVLLSDMSLLSLFFFHHLEF